MRCGRISEPPECCLQHTQAALTRSIGGINNGSGYLQAITHFLHIPTQDSASELRRGSNARHSDCCRLDGIDGALMRGLVFDLAMATIGCIVALMAMALS